MKTIFIILLALVAVGCSSNTRSQRPPIKEIYKEYNTVFAEPYVEKKIMTLAGYTNGVGIAGSAKDEMPVVGSISTRAGYLPYEDRWPGYLYFENTNDKWVVIFFHPASEPSETPPHLNKITEYVYWYELK